jgi:serine O-acetyltransferase
VENEVSTRPVGLRRAWHETRRAFFSLEAHVLALHRLGRFCARLPGVGTTLALVVRHAMRVYSGCDLSFDAEIGRRLRLPHPLGIVIGDGVRIGDDVMLWHGVTLGSHGRRGTGRTYPTIGDGVRIYANASVIGPVTIGAGAIVGAHALVTIDVPPGATAVGVPARVVGRPEAAGV